MTPLKDILNIAVPKIPLELQDDARQDESYAFTGCIDMIVALNIDADVIWEETEEITDEGDEYTECYMRASPSIR